MGRSVTVNVIGMTEDEHIDDTVRYEEVCAMTKLEMAQQKKVMADRGKPIVNWYAQTKQGCRMLGTNDIGESISDDQVKHVKTVVCPICGGIGGKVGENGFRHGCVICDGSGITKKSYWKKWAPWQVEEMKKEFGTN